MQVGHKVQRAGAILFSHGSGAGSELYLNLNGIGGGGRGGEDGITHMHTE